MQQATPIARTEPSMAQQLSKLTPGFCHVPLCNSDAIRAAKNIAQWNHYLPGDCVRTMVRLGWDYTT